MISIPFSYPKDNNLKLLIQFDHWFSRQKDFTIRQDSTIVEESEVVEDVYVAKAGENYYSIRFEPNLLTPTLFIEKEPFVLGEKFKWHDYVLFTIMTVVIFTFSPIVFESRTSNLGIFTAPLLYFIARYISLSNSPWKRILVWTMTGLLVGIELFFW